MAGFLFPQQGQRALLGSGNPNSKQHRVVFTKSPARSTPRLDATFPISAQGAFSDRIGYLDQVELLRIPMVQPANVRSPRLSGRDHGGKRGMLTQTLARRFQEFLYAFRVPFLRRFRAHQKTTRHSSEMNSIASSYSCRTNQSVKNS